MQGEEGGRETETETDRERQRQTEREGEREGSNGEEMHRLIKNVAGEEMMKQAGF